jgi:nitrogen fixation NifU-like protein
MEHVTNPDHHEELAGECCRHEGVNPSCGDDLTLSLELASDGTIADAAWQGTGCAVCQGSADMACDAMLGRTPAEAAEVCHLFGEMVRGEVSDPAALEPLDEAASLVSVAHMPARVKCAELAWRTLEEMLAGGEPANVAVPQLR